MKRLLKRHLKRIGKWATGIYVVYKMVKDGFDAYDTLKRVYSLLDDARTAMKPVVAGVVAFIATSTAPSSVDPPTAPLREVPSSFALHCTVANANQINSTVSAEWRVFENMNVNDCNRMVRVATNTSLTPGTGAAVLAGTAAGELRLSFYTTGSTSTQTNS